MQSSSAVEELEAGFFDTVGSFFINYGWATVALVIIFVSAKPYVEGAYRSYKQKKSYEAAVDPERVSVLDEQRARAFEAREAALLKEAEERKEQLKELKKKRDAEGKSLKPIEPAGGPYTSRPVRWADARVKQRRKGG